ncbi:reverse transcriptase domain-containing protein [Tanacetum coccineum]
MSMQSSSNQIELHFPNPEKSLQFRQVEESESDNLFHDHIQGEDENAEDVQMADHLRPIEELLRIPIICIENAIVVPAVLASEFELKTELLDFIRAAESWLENEPPNSITTWDDLVSKFLNRFYPHSKTREIRKEITNFQQVFSETFTEAWERFKDLLRKCPHHGFSLLHQIDFFYNGLSQSDQDSLNTAAGGNLMMRNIQEALTTIENKARLRTCRNKPQVSSSGETYDRNQEAPIQLMQNQMGQMTEDSQERPLGRADDFVYRIDIVDSLCDKFPIKNNSLSGNPTPSSGSVVESLSPLPTLFGNSDSLVEETDTLLSHFNDSLPDYETFCFDIEEKSSGSTTSHFDLSLPEYESFCFDHIEEKSSGSTTSHFDLSLPEYESFYFDHMEKKSSGSTTTHSDYSLSDYEAFYLMTIILKRIIDPFHPADRSDSHHEEFVDELAHIISPPEYDRF